MIITGLSIVRGPTLENCIWQGTALSRDHDFSWIYYESFVGCGGGSTVAHVRGGVSGFYTLLEEEYIKKYCKDVSREFDEFRVNTHLCTLRCWYLYHTSLYG